MSRGGKNRAAYSSACPYGKSGQTAQISEQGEQEHIRNVAYKSLHRIVNIEEAFHSILLF